MNIHTVNETLGFQKIIVINLPQRTDRKDAMVLMAATTDIEIDFSHALRGVEVDDTALVTGHWEDGPSSAARGSWRSHLDVIRNAVQDRLSTTLILEDDVDWDVRLRDQVSSVWNTIHENDLMEHWDVLWLGHLGETFERGEPSLMRFYDKTLPHSLTRFYSQNMAWYPTQTRILHPSHFPLGTFAYAVSYEGAKKILYNIGINSAVATFHDSLALQCQTSLTCLSLTPGLFHDYRAIGVANKQSSSFREVHQEMDQELFNINIDMSVRRHMKQQLQKPKKDPQIPLTKVEISRRWTEAIEDERWRL